MLDVLVTCVAYSKRPARFPQVRGYYLAQHLRRLGLRAEFRPLPLGPTRCEVLIWSDYQSPFERFERRLAGALSEVRADRLFCMLDYSLGERDHFSRAYSEWFAARGGVLCQGLESPLAPYEHWIGVGVDTDVVPTAGAAPDGVLFDLTGSSRRNVAARFDTDALPAIRHVLPDARLIGSGPPEASIVRAFDTWVPYDQPHSAYVAATLEGCFAVVTGGFESLGLLLAEAQVAGACVVSGAPDVKDWVVCPAAKVQFRRADRDSLVGALQEARRRDPGRIAGEARARFDYSAVARRTREAVGL